MCSYCVVRKWGLCRLENPHTSCRVLLIEPTGIGEGAVGRGQYPQQALKSFVSWIFFFFLTRVLVSWTLQALNSKKMPADRVASFLLASSMQKDLPLQTMIVLQCKNTFWENSISRCMWDGHSTGSCPVIRAQSLVWALNHLELMGKSVLIKGVNGLVWKTQSSRPHHSYKWQGHSTCGKLSETRMSLHRPAKFGQGRPGGLHAATMAGILPTESVCIMFSAPLCFAVSFVAPPHLPGLLFHTRSSSFSPWASPGPSAVACAVVVQWGLHQDIMVVGPMQTHQNVLFAMGDQSQWQKSQLNGETGDESSLLHD